MAPVVDDFYAVLKQLGCVPCADCGGDYRPPDHTAHRSVFPSAAEFEDAQARYLQRTTPPPPEPLAPAAPEATPEPEVAPEADGPEPVTG